MADVTLSPPTHTDTHRHTDTQTHTHTHTRGLLEFPQDWVSLSFSLRQPDELSPTL